MAEDNGKQANQESGGGKSAVREKAPDEEKRSVEEMEKALEEERRKRVVAEKTLEVEERRATARTARSEEHDVASEAAQSACAADAFSGLASVGRIQQDLFAGLKEIALQAFRQPQTLRLSHCPSGIGGARSVATKARRPSAPSPPS